SVRQDWAELLKDEVEKHQFQFLKNQLIGFLLFKQGDPHLGKEYYDKAQENADYLQDNIYRMMICHHKNSFYSRRKDQAAEEFRQYIQYLKKISFDLAHEVECMIYYLESTSYTNKELEYYHKAKEILSCEQSFLQQVHEKKNPRAEMYLRLMLIHYKKAVQDLSGFLSEVQNLLNLIQEYPGLNHPRRIRSLLAFAADSYLNICRLEVATEINRLLIQSVSTDTPVFVDYSIRLMACRFFTESPEAGLEHAIQLSTNPLLNYYKQQAEVISIFIAIFKFILGLPVNFHYYFKEVSMIADDKNAVFIDMRIMEILDLLNKELFDVAESRIEALRKHLERYPESLPHYHHYYKILHKMAYFSFDYSKLFHTEWLEEPERIDFFCPISSDLVNPRIWLLAKQENLTYYEMICKEFKRIEAKFQDVITIDVKPYLNVS
ncbi:MAG: hypothetical protein NZ108_09745, partial [Bacteroidia bacterium]|nr:hypothetical protein [Bacteroidia bacterium]